MMHLNEYLSGEVLELIEKYMPGRGEGDNQAGQACTAVNKLIYKWYNDGDVFDNTGFIKGWCNDLSDYANWLYNHNLGKDILYRIYSIKSEKEYEEILKDLASEVINKQSLTNLEKEPLDGTIYNCSGPFTFVEDFLVEDYDDEEDW